MQECPLQTTENTHNAFKLQALIFSIDFHTKPPPSEETHVNKDWVMLLESSSAFLVVHSHSWATRDRWVEKNRRMIKIDAIEVKIPWLWFPRMCQTSEMLDHAFPCCHRQPVFVWPSLSSCPQCGAQASCKEWAVHNPWNEISRRCHVIHFLGLDTETCPCTWEMYQYTAIRQKQAKVQLKWRLCMIFPLRGVRSTRVQWYEIQLS